MRTVRAGWVRTLSAALLVVCAAASAAEPETRLALIYPAEVAALGDLLTAELSREPGIVLVEREQVRKVIDEKGLNLTEPGKAGEILGAEGLVILEKPTTEGPQKKAPVRLIWAERGIVVHETVIPMAAKDLSASVGYALPQIKLALKKLGELRRAGGGAVAMHFQGINSDAGGELELRQGLALLFAQRMQSEPGWVVVDRRNLTEAVFENELSRSGEIRKPVNSTHRLSVGFSREGALLKLRGKLELPDGTSRAFLFSGKFDEPGALAKAMMIELRSVMGLAENSPVSAWDPNAEAKLLFEWAKQTYLKSSFGNIPGREIYEAASAAWALGLRQPEVGQLRAIGLCDWAWPKSGSALFRTSSISKQEMSKDLGAVERMLGALELARDAWALPSSQPIFFENLNPAELAIPYWAGEMLRAIYDDEVEGLFAPELPRLRKAIREAVEAIPSTKWIPSQRYAKSYSERWKKHVFALTVVKHASLWEDNYGAAQERMEKVLLSIDLEENEQWEPLWKKFEQMLEDGHIYGHYGFERQHRYSECSLFYARLPTDEPECLRRSQEIAAKLAASSSIYRQSLARAIEKRLSELSDKEPILALAPKVQVAKLGPYFTDKQLKEKVLPGNDPWRISEPEKKVDFILQLLLQRGTEQYLNKEIFEDIYQMWNGNSRERFAPADALRLAEGIDDYWKAIEPLRKSAGKAVISYTERMGTAMDVLRNNYPAVDAAMRQRSPDRPTPAEAFEVSHCWSVKDWKGQISRPFLADCQSDGVNLYIPQTPEGSLFSTVQAVTMISPPNWQPKRILNSAEPIDGGASHSLAVDGRFFFAATKMKCIELYLLAPGRAPVSQKLAQQQIANFSFLGFFSPYLYFQSEARNPGERENRCQLNRWNVESNKIELLGDSLRIPNVNSLDAALGWKPGQHRWAIALPNGDVGLLMAPYGRRGFQSVEMAVAFQISAKTGVVSELGPWNPKAPPETAWASPFRAGAAQCAWAQTKPVSGAAKQLEVSEDSAFFPTRMLYQGPVPAPVSWMAGMWKRSDPMPHAMAASALMLNGVATELPPGSSPISGSFSPFMVGDIHGIVTFERIKGREGRAQIGLTFIEPEGLKSIPLRFELPGQDLGPLLSYFRNELKWEIGDDYRPRPFTDDKAWGLKDTLVISNARARILWFLSRDELLAARKVAR